MSLKSPLIILGLDAGDPELIEQFAAAGHLPNIRSIMDRGWHARLGGRELFAEHGIWASLVSGLSREELGYYYFRQLKPGTYDIVAASGLDLDAPPFWSALAGTGRKAAIIDVTDTYPIQGLDGAQLANWAIHLGWVTNDPAYAPCALPADLLDQAKRVFGPREPIIENSNATVDEDKLLLKRLLAHVSQKGALCRHILADGGHDLVFAVFHEVHTAAHQFWKYRPQAQGSDDARDDPALATAIRDVYAATDRELGTLLERLGPESNVVIVGTVGLKDYYPTAGLGEAFLRKLGYQVSPPQRVSFKPMDVARRLLPESVRIALSKRLSREARERIVAQQFRSGTDWSRTTAFSLPTFFKTFIRVNLRGREPDGIVEPGQPYLDLLARLELDLRGLIDARTGQSAIASIERAVDRFGSEPPRTLPDMFVEWNAPHFLSRLIHPKTEIVQTRPEWYRPSDHTHEGFIAAAGPAFNTRGKRDDVLVADLAPTFLKLLALPSSPRHKGQVLPEIR